MDRPGTPRYANGTQSFPRLYRLSFSTDQFVCHLTPLQSYECYNCDFKTDLKVTLINHVSPIHNHEKTTGGERTPLKSYNCTNCNFRSFSMLFFTKHLYNCNKFERGYKCEECSSSYTRKDHLRRHIVKEHVDLKYIKWFKCDQCMFQTMFTSHLNKHTLRRHSLLVPVLQCEYCTYKTKTKDNLKRHVKLTHVDPNEIVWNKCELCSYECESKKDLERHKKRKHTPLDVILKCSYCTYVTNIKGDLEMHRKTHTEIGRAKWIECKECPFKCRRKYDLKKHNMKEHTHHQFFCDLTPLRSYRCVSCNFRTDLKVALRNHGRSTHEHEEISDWERTLEKPYDCERCDFQTFSALVLAKHWFTCDRQIANRERPYKCERCSSSYKRRDHLKDHFRRKHADSKNVEWLKCKHCTYQTLYTRSLYRHTLTKHSPFAIELQCEYCSYKTKTKETLRRHTKREHLGPEAMLWTHCELCPFKSKWKRDVERHHKRKHTPLAIALKCTHCTYTTNIKREWLMHKKIHDEVKSIDCELCHFKCKYQSHMDRHKRTHSKPDEWIQCEQCSFKTADKWHLKTHMTRKHSLLPMTLPCRHCEYSTKINGDLEKHIRRKHVDVSGVEYFKCEQCSYKTNKKNLLLRHAMKKHLNSKDV